jgi:hypothetical protein
MAKNNINYGNYNHKYEYHDSYQHNTQAYTNKALIIAGSIGIALLIIFLIPQFPQPTWYNDFADKREVMGIPHFSNVFSNLPFAILGILGLSALRDMPSDRFISKPYEKGAFAAIYWGAILGAIGATYYHLDPNNSTLVWDRLAISLVVMPLMCIAMSERMDPKVGYYALIPTVLAGIVGTSIWEYTETTNHGDLRYYLAVELLPFLAIMMILVLFPSKYNRISGWVHVLLWLVLSRVFEFSDLSIYQATNHFISGHTLKHVSAAIALVYLIWHMGHRVPRLRYEDNFLEDTYVEDRATRL